MNGLYVHIPFCGRKCYYCSFAISVGQDRKALQYVRCLSHEAEAYAGTPVDTLYIGGGTPSRLSAGELALLFAGLRGNFVVSPDAEITLECNPDDVESSRCEAWVAAGVNRISLGVQSFQGDVLQYLGRSHSAAQAHSAYAQLRSAGFENVSVDLMFGHEHQTYADLNSDLDTITELAPRHVSLYALTIEEPSRFFARAVKTVDQPEAVRMYDQIIDRLEDGGLRQYEVSNFAREGFESRHNAGYWMGRDYIGLGMSAHSCFRGQRYWNVEKLTDYFRRVEAGDSPVMGREDRSKMDVLKDLIIFGLRMRAGIDLGEVVNRSGCVMPVATEREIDLLTEEGLLERNRTNLRATRRGMRVLDDIAVRLI